MALMTYFNRFGAHALIAFGKGYGVGRAQLGVSTNWGGLYVRERPILCGPYFVPPTFGNCHIFLQRA